MHQPLDTPARLLLAAERIDRLRRDAEASGAAPGRARGLIGRALVDAGLRLAPSEAHRRRMEPGPSAPSTG